MCELLEDRGVYTILVDRYERAIRFSDDAMHSLMVRAGVRIRAAEPGLLDEDLEPDALDVLTRLCGRVPGVRSSRRRAVRVLRAMEMIE